MLSTASFICHFSASPEFLVLSASIHVWCIPVRYSRYKSQSTSGRGECTGESDLPWPDCIDLRYQAGLFDRTIRVDFVSVTYLACITTKTVCRQWGFLFLNLMQLSEVWYICSFFRKHSRQIPSKPCTNMSKGVPPKPANFLRRRQGMAAWCSKLRRQGLPISDPAAELRNNSSKLIYSKKLERRGTDASVRKQVSEFFRSDSSVCFMTVRSPREHFTIQSSIHWPQRWNLTNVVCILLILVGTSFYSSHAGMIKSTFITTNLMPKTASIITDLYFPFGVAQSMQCQCHR